MRFMIEARYSENEEFGTWQVPAFLKYDDAVDYINRTVDRYVNEYGHEFFEMRISKISEREAWKLERMLRGLFD